MSWLWKSLAFVAFLVVFFVGGYILGITGGVLSTFMPRIGAYFVLGMIILLFLLWLEPWKWFGRKDEP